MVVELEFVHKLSNITRQKRKAIIRAQNCLIRLSLSVQTSKE
jgi:hypothetical protein